MVAMRKIIALVLGGGRGTRLYPLTKLRSKPAVPLAGKYRLIDIPISNCINSGLNRIYVLTQFNSVSLHRHIRRTYTSTPSAAASSRSWPRSKRLTIPTGTKARPTPCGRTFAICKQPGIDYVLILSGDQLYRMDYNDMIATHVKTKADVTIAALAGATARRQPASASCGWTIRAAWSASWKSPRPRPSWRWCAPTRPGWTPAASTADGRDCLASMGIYLFNRDKLVDLLNKTDYHDFGKEIFPASIRTHRVQVHLFDGYWEDIGTIKSFYQANLDLARSDPPST